MTPEELAIAVGEVTALEGEALDTRVEELILAEELSQNQAAEIISLKAYLEKARLNPNELRRSQKTFTVGGKEYRFKVGFLKFFIGGDAVLADDVAEDQAMYEKLVDINFGGIEEIS